jgi:hypothetical protein
MSLIFPPFPSRYEATPIGFEKQELTASSQFSNRILRNPLSATCCIQNGLEKVRASFVLAEAIETSYSSDAENKDTD